MKYLLPQAQAQSHSSVFWDNGTGEIVSSPLGEAHKKPDQFYCILHLNLDVGPSHFEQRDTDHRSENTEQF